LVTNNAATTYTGILSRLALLNAGFSIIKLFSPEHGLSAVGADGSFQKNSTDSITGLPVISLYSDKLAPDEMDLADIDSVFYDIPDIGCRFYTYLWTMTYVMEACARYQKSFVVPDRPNPIGGNFQMTEGPLLDETTCSSFIGRWNIPVKHSCTLGELAKYFNTLKSIDCDLEVVPAQNWQRNKTILENSWFFVPPSPAIKDTETALFYPGMGLLEGINVNEGRGTDTPFKIFGAPWINATHLQEEFALLNLPGVTTHAKSYIPNDGLYAKIVCYGLAMHITDYQRFFPVYMVYQLLRVVMQLYPDQCKEKLYITNANPSGTQHLDKLTGMLNAFNKIKNGDWADNNMIIAEWKKVISPYLIYQ
jgi:uncharacterized protein YbbC (DUF1343 family)